MELTGKLEEQVDRKKTRKEAKEVIKETIEDAETILDDEELDQVSGGDGAWFWYYQGPPK